MLAGHFTTCAGISEGEGAREGRDEEREITSHPAPSRLNYSNLTHMGWPPRPREGAEESRRVGEERGSLLWEITHLTSG